MKTVEFRIANKCVAFALPAPQTLDSADVQESFVGPAMLALGESVGRWDAASPPNHQQLVDLAKEAKLTVYYRPAAVDPATVHETVPCTIEAVRFTGDGPGCEAVTAFLGGNDRHVCVWKDCTYDGGFLKTPEGDHEFRPGDWIVRGLLGEHYPVKNEVFERKYRAAPELVPSRLVPKE